MFFNRNKEAEEVPGFGKIETTYFWKEMDAGQYRRTSYGVASTLSSSITHGRRGGLHIPDPCSNTFNSLASLGEFLYNHDKFIRDDKTISGTHVMRAELPHFLGNVSFNPHPQSNSSRFRTTEFEDKELLTIQRIFDKLGAPDRKSYDAIKIPDGAGLTHIPLPRTH